VWGWGGGEFGFLAGVMPVSFGGGGGYTGSHKYAYIHIYVHIYIHTYMIIYIHTYIHTYTTPRRLT